MAATRPPAGPQPFGLSGPKSTGSRFGFDLAQRLSCFGQIPLQLSQPARAACLRGELTIGLHPALFRLSKTPRQLRLTIRAGSELVCDLPFARDEEFQVFHASGRTFLYDGLRIAGLGWWRARRDACFSGQLPHKSGHQRVNCHREVSENQRLVSGAPRMEGLMVLAAGAGDSTASVWVPLDGRHELDRRGWAKPSWRWHAGGQGQDSLTSTYTPLVSLVANFMGDWLRDALDPRLKNLR